MDCACAWARTNGGGKHEIKPMDTSSSEKDTPHVLADFMPDVKVIPLNLTLPKNLPVKVCHCPDREKWEWDLKLLQDEVEGIQERLNVSRDQKESVEAALVWEQSRVEQLEEEVSELKEVIEDLKSREKATMAKERRLSRSLRLRAYARLMLPVRDLESTMMKVRKIMVDNLQSLLPEDDLSLDDLTSASSPEVSKDFNDVWISKQCPSGSRGSTCRKVKRLQKSKRKNPIILSTGNPTGTRVVTQTPPEVKCLDLMCHERMPDQSPSPAPEPLSPSTTEAHELLKEALAHRATQIEANNGPPRDE